MGFAELVAIALGLFVGLSLGALGGGGSTLAVPILVFVAGLTTSEATSASLIVVGVASAVGAIGHWRHGHVKVAAGFAFGAAGIVGSYIGTRLNRSLPDDTLLLAFSVLIVFVAARMYRKANAATSPSVDAVIAAEVDRPLVTSESATHASALEANLPGEPVLAVATSSGTAPSATSPDAIGDGLTIADYAKLAVAATGVGVLTGLFGVGGGFAVVPALVIFLKFNTKDAIGTSLLVIAINTMVALFMRRNGLASFEWSVVLPFVATTTIGVIIGLRAAKNIDAERLTKAFAVMLFVVAVYTAASVILT